MSSFEARLWREIAGQALLAVGDACEALRDQIKHHERESDYARMQSIYADLYAMRAQFDQVRAIIDLAEGRPVDGWADE